MLPPPSPRPQNSREKKIKKNKSKQSNKNKQTNKKQIHKQTNKDKPSTVAPELVSLDCRLTHVLQAPNTQPYQG